MNELRSYLNSLSLDEQRDFSCRCGTSVGYLRKAISKNQVLGAALSVLIEIHSAIRNAKVGGSTPLTGTSHANNNAAYLMRRCCL